MSFQLTCKNGVVDFPTKFHVYSEVIERMIGMDKDIDVEGSGSEDEDEDNGEKVEQISIRATQESVKRLFHLLEMSYAKDPNNIQPPETPKKVTASKFKLEDVIHPDVIEFFDNTGKDGVFEIVQVADFLGIKLVNHMCFTWIAHNLNTRNTEKKMEWLGLNIEKAPTFEEVLAVNLKTGYIPSLHNKEGGASKQIDR
jgi:hypothetical protein